ncbi:divalent-cation tolerance protein CutA [Candidatus Woesearchaeota archaeon]|nr:divalent-cation tolerance protein CutA [Candidatus Woesearchaeota archaeon]
MIVVYITCRDSREAKSISNHLLKRRLAACTNSFPVRSSFWWKGKLEDSKEVVVLAKSTEKKYTRIVSEVRKIHSYKIPCIMKIPVTFNKEYQNWILSELV